MSLILLLSAGRSGTVAHLSQAVRHTSGTAHSRLPTDNYHLFQISPQLQKSYIQKRESASERPPLFKKFKGAEHPLSRYSSKPSSQSGCLAHLSMYIKRCRLSNNFRIQIFEFRTLPTKFSYVLSCGSALP
ncbi:hypothetical protein F5Y11DRAFT_79805 [Daldinia sp. FL1419]|nr:hypothetical protein F5Y11DRAFT_79805 [Daldinia sp. FL1419]